jgi:hypothetical protein
MPLFSAAGEASMNSSSLENLTIIFGAGASCACGAYAPGRDDQYPPPLAKDIFAPVFDDILGHCPQLRNRVREVRIRLARKENVEEILRDLYEVCGTAPEVLAISNQVAWIRRKLEEDDIEDGTLYFTVRFKDKTDFSLRYACDMFVVGADFCDFKTGDFEMIREYMRPIPR